MKKLQAAAVRSQTARKRSTSSERYFIVLEIKNFRSFGPEGQTLDLSDGAGRPARWTIIIGNNGTGKTTLLQCLVAMAVMTVPRKVALEKSGNGERTQILGRSHSETFTYFLENSRQQSEVFAELTLGVAVESKIKGNATHFYVEFSNIQISHVRRFMSVGRRATNSLKGTSTHLETPDCYAYGAGRRLGRSSLSVTESTDPTRSLFHDDEGLRNAEEWLLRLDYSASKSSRTEKKAKERLEQVRQLLIEILPDVSDIRFVTPEDEPIPTPRVEFSTPYGWVRLRNLGYGYQTLVAWMVDLASRMVERHPDSPDPLAEPAIVLVDEIDLHLHPTWQRKLIGFLTERFPKTQFIATAHSPLIVQAAQDANIVLLRQEGDHVVIDNDVDQIRGWRIDQILTSDLFGLQSARPPAMDDLLARRKRILTKPKLTKKLKEELAEIEAQIGTLPTGENAEQVKMMEQIDQTLRLLRENQGRSS